MDLVAGGNNIIVTITHLSKHGESVAEIIELTQGELVVNGDIPEMKFS